MPSTEIVMATSIPATGLVSKMSDVTIEKSFTSADDCFSGGTDPALTTYEACCQPLLDDNTVRRSFVSNGRCFECIRK